MRRAFFALSDRSWSSLLCFGWVALTCVFLAAFSTAEPASAQPSEKIALRFDVLAHGTRVYDIGIDYDLTPTTYKATVTAETTGLIGFFVNEKMQMSASGSLSGAAIRPAWYTYSHQDSDGSKTARLSWQGSNVESQRSFKLADYRAQALEQAVDAKLPDPLSGILAAVLAPAEAPCTGTQRVYDGKEVFELAFSYVRRAELNQRQRAYRGPAYECSVRYRTVAGLSKKRTARNHSDPPVYTVWFAPVRSTELGRDILLPVAASGKIKGRDVQIMARRATLDGRPLEEVVQSSR